mmetsp:Transcript_5104/g.7087  ORF Transcript_5104/g.7087 Transcript_5104/m.7087 type:complete len:151 (+) Transcript_5104:342-794(+)
MAEEVVQLAGGCHSLIYILLPGHQGIPGNEEADRLAANLAVKNGIYTSRRLVGGRSRGGGVLLLALLCGPPAGLQALRPESGGGAVRQQHVGQGRAPGFRFCNSTATLGTTSTTGSTWSSRLPSVSGVMRTRLWSTTCCGVRGGLIFGRR